MFNKAEAVELGSARKDRILCRILARAMDEQALFKDPEAARRGVLDFDALGTTCTDSNGEEDSG